MGVSFRAWKMGAACLAPLVFGACSVSEEGQIADHCKKLVTDGLVAPSSARFIDSAIYRRVHTNHRAPEGFRDLGDITADLERISTEAQFATRQLQIMKGDSGSVRRAEEVRAKAQVVQDEFARYQYARVLLRDHPWGEAYWELDSQNRAGATLRSVGVCTWKDDGSDWRDSIELSGFGEGRLPTSPPAPFSG